MFMEYIVGANRSHQQERSRSEGKRGLALVEGIQGSLALRLWTREGSVRYDDGPLTAPLGNIGELWRDSRKAGTGL